MHGGGGIRMIHYTISALSYSFHYDARRTNVYLFFMKEKKGGGIGEGEEKRDLISAHHYTERGGHSKLVVRGAYASQNRLLLIMRS